MRDGLETLNGIGVLLWLAGTFGVLGATFDRWLHGGVDLPTAIAISMLGPGLFVSLVVIVIRRARESARVQAWKGRRDVN